MTLPLAPAIIIIAFSPWSSTVIKACPVGISFITSILEISTPTPFKLSRSFSPFSSLPTAPIMAMFPPNLPAANA